jgi:predicted permease
MLATTLLGEQGVAQSIFSALGAELVVWTLGLQALTGSTVPARRGDGTPPSRAARLADGARRLAAGLRNLASMPLLAMAAAAGWLLLRHHAGATLGAFQTNAAGGAFTDMVATALQMTGQATIPLAAIIVGSRIAEIRAGHLFTRLIVLTTFLRLAAIPALATLLLFWLPFPPAVRPALLIVAVQPCSMASVMFGEAYGCDARFAAATVLATHAACLLTIPLWLSAPWWG